MHVSRPHSLKRLHNKRYNNVQLSLLRRARKTTQELQNSYYQCTIIKHYSSTVRHRLEEYVHTKSGGLHALYSLRAKDAESILGYNFHRYSKSTAMLVMTEFPEHAWSAWNFLRAPTGWWGSLSFLFEKNDPLAETVVRLYLEDTYAISYFQDCDHKIDVQMLQYRLQADRYVALYLGGAQNVASRMTSQISFPASHTEKSLNPKTVITSRKSWKDPRERRAYLEQLLLLLCSPGEAFSFDLAYKLTQSMVIQHQGSHLLRLYDMSLTSALLGEFPEEAWKPWLFNKVTKSWWKQLHDLYLANDPVAHAIVQDAREYLSVDIMPSVESGVESRVPEQLPKDADVKAITQFLESILGSVDKLYQLNSMQLSRAGATHLTHEFGSSHAHMVMTYFPDRNWLPWKFTRTPCTWWNDLTRLFKAGDAVATTKVLEYLDDLAYKYQIRGDHDWALLTHRILSITDSRRVLSLGGWRRILCTLYPRRGSAKHPVTHNGNQRHVIAFQKHLRKQLRTIIALNPPK